MKKTLVAMTLMCGSAFAQDSNPSGAGAGAPGNYPPAGEYGVPSNTYPAPGQDPYSMGGAGGPGNYAPGAGNYPSGPGNYPAGPGNYPAGPGNYPPGGGYAAGAYAAPAACGPGYVWIDGYNDANGYFVNGYCAVPPFSGAYWVSPGFFGGRFVAGYWGRGGIGYGSRFGVRGGYGPNYGVRGGFREGAGVARGYAGGFRAPATSGGSFQSRGSFHPQVVAPSSHSQSGYRGGASATRGGGSAMHGGGGGHGGRR
jgi:hypothetical protein